MPTSGDTDSRGSYTGSESQDDSRSSSEGESISGIAGSDGCSTRSGSQSGHGSSTSSASTDEITARYASGKSSVPTSASRRGGGSSRTHFSDGSSNTSSSEGTVDEYDNNQTLKSRMKGLFKTQPGDETTQGPAEVLGHLQERVDPKLLTEVEEYDAVPSEAASYGKRAFWDERYAGDEEVVEWYHPWSNLAPTLTQYMDEDDAVLICGCGNSELSVDMYDDGFTNVTNADVSRVVIHQMKETYPAYDMQWRALDLTRADFPDEKFDVALDKACLDSIICVQRGESRVHSYLQQMDRILQPEGAFICVSFTPPEQRLEMLEYWDLEHPEKCLAWDVHVDAIAKPETMQGRRERQRELGESVYFIYVCIKDPGKTAEKKAAKERSKREQEKRLNKMLGFRGRGRGRRGRGGRRG